MMADSILNERLAAELEGWGWMRPFGFAVHPADNNDGDITWECGVPGPKNSEWEDGYFRVLIRFPKQYPKLPPKCYFDPALFHPNVYPSGRISLSSLEASNWVPQTTVKTILLGVQQLMATPNPQNPARAEAVAMFLYDNSTYVQRARGSAAEHKPPPNYPIYRTSSKRRSTTKSNAAPLTKSSTPATNLFSAVPTKSSLFNTAPNKESTSPAFSFSKPPNTSFAFGSTSAGAGASLFSKPSESLPNPGEHSKTPPVFSFSKPSGTSPAFGAGAGTSLFGKASESPGKPGGNIFGAPSSSGSSSNDFGTSSFGSTSKGGLFGGNTPPSKSSLFGQTSTSPGAFGKPTIGIDAPKPNLLGISTTPVSTNGGLFGSNASSNKFGTPSNKLPLSSGISQGSVQFGSGSATKPLSGGDSQSTFSFGSTTAGAPKLEFGQKTETLSASLRGDAVNNSTENQSDKTDSSSAYKLYIEQWTSWVAQEKKLASKPNVKPIKKILLKTFRSSFADNVKASTIETEVTNQISSLSDADALQFAGIFVAKSLCMIKSTGIEIGTAINIGNAFWKVYSAFVENQNESGDNFLDFSLSALAEASSMTVPYYPSDIDERFASKIDDFEAIEGAADAQQYFDNLRTRMRILAAIVKARPKSMSKCFGFDWITKCMNSNPIKGLTPLAIRCFLEIAGHRMQSEYPKYFGAVINAISEELLPAVKINDPKTPPEILSEEEWKVTSGYVVEILKSGCKCPDTGSCAGAVNSTNSYGLAKFPPLSN